MIDMAACLINFFLIDIVNAVQAWKLQVYESATCHSSYGCYCFCYKQAAEVSQ